MIVIVTGYRKHVLPLVSYQGIPIIKPADFLALVPPQQGGGDG